MKNNLGRFLVPTGAFLCTVLLAFANQPESEQSSQDDQQQQSESVSLQQGSVIEEPSGAERSSTYRQSTTTSQTQTSFGTLQKGTDLIGMDIRNQQDQRIGQVKDLMIDPKQGRVPFAVVSSGGLFGLGDRLLVVPPSALSAQGEENKLVLNLSESQIRNAPSFARDQWPDFSNQKWTSDVYQFYGQRPYWGSQTFRSSTEIEEPSGAAITAPSSASSVSIHQYQAGGTADADWIDAEGDRKLHLYQRGKGSAEFTDRQLKESAPPNVIIPSGEYSAYSRQTSTYGTAPSVAIVPGTYRSQSSYSATPGSYSASTTRGIAGTPQFYKASELIGMNINNAQGQTVGEIKDFAVDMSSGRVAYSVLGSGGFLGVGDRLIAVPMTVFTPGADAQHLTLNVDAQKLRNAPEFDNSNWEAASNQEFVSRVYSHYGQQPYWQASGFRDPSGVQRQQFQQNDYQQQFKSEQQGSQFDRQQREQRINEPSGAESTLEQKSSSELESSEQKSESSTELSEPSGAEQQQQQQQPQSIESSEPQSSSSEAQSSQQQSESTLSEPSGASQDQEQGLQPQISEPSGAQKSSEVESSEQKSELEQEKEQPERQSDLNIQSDVSKEPAGAQPGAATESQSESQSQQSSQETSAPATGAESSAQTSEQPQTDVQSEQSSQAQAGQTSESSTEVTEPSGAQSSQQSATQSQSQTEVQSEAAGAATTTQDQATVQKIQTALKSDTTLSGASNIQVTMENGKIVVRGTVNSEAEKKAIEQKIKDYTFENQIQVQGEEGQQPDPSSSEDDADDDAGSK